MEDNGYFMFLDAKKIRSSRENRENRENPKKQTKCVIFDFDGTLVTKANADKAWLHETDPYNFVFLHGVRKKLLSYIQKGIHIFVASNQKYMNDAKKQMFEIFYELFEGKISIFVANRQNRFRKPDTCILDYIKKHFEILFYCGDAIGNSSDFPPYQYQDTDLAFARNAGVRFKTPIEVFGTNFYSYIPKKQVVIMMGIQGSGKTSFARRLETEGFIRFSQDEHGNLVKNLKEIEEYVRNGDRVILDATHRKHSLRKVFIDMAERNDANWIICWCVRDGRPFNSLREKPIHPAGISLYVKEFQRPESNYAIIS